MSTTELAIVNPQNAVQIFTGGGLNAVLEAVESQVRAMTLDGSTPAGRDEIRSVAYKVTRTKTALDAEAKKLTEGWRTSTAQVNAERKRAQERLDALADEVREPLTAFENREKNRIAAHEAALGEINQLCLAREGATAEELQAQLARLADLYSDRAWEEYRDRVGLERCRIREYLTERLESRQKHDADQAELKRLRDEEAVRTVREREERLKTEAADKARIEAERRAKEASDAEARRVIEAAETERKRVEAEASRARTEHERVQRETEAARQREEDAREAAEQRLIDAEAARVKAEAARVEAIRKADADKKVASEKAAEAARVAEVKAARDSELAAQAERDKIERERKAEESARLKRETDEANRQRICREITEDLLSLEEAGTPDLEALAVAIMDGKLRHVKVVF